MRHHVPSTSLPPQGPATPAPFSFSRVTLLRCHHLPMGKGSIVQHPPEAALSVPRIQYREYSTKNTDGRLEKEMSRVDPFCELCLFSELGLGLQTIFPAHLKLQAPIVTNLSTGLPGDKAKVTQDLPRDLWEDSQTREEAGSREQARSSHNAGGWRRWPTLTSARRKRK